MIGITFVTGNKRLYGKLAKLYEYVMGHADYPRPPHWTEHYNDGGISLMCEDRHYNCYCDSPDPYYPGIDYIEPDALPRIRSRFRTPYFYYIDYHSTMLMGGIIRELAKTESFFVDIDDGAVYTEAEFVERLKTLPRHWGYASEERV